MAAPLLSAEGLRAGYATGDVLQGVGLEVGAGEIVGVLGRAEPDFGLGHRAGQGPLLYFHHLPYPVHAVVGALEVLEICRGQRDIDEAEVLDCLHPEDVTGDSGKQLRRVPLLPEPEGVGHLHEVAADLECGRLQLPHPGRQLEKGRPGAGRGLGRHGGCGFLARHARLRRDLEAGQQVGVLDRVLRLPVGLPVFLYAGAVAAGFCSLRHADLAPCGGFGDRRDGVHTSAPIT